MAKRDPKAGIRPGTWLHRMESARANDGARLCVHCRRRVEAVDGDVLRLGGIERAETPEGEAPSGWESWSGILRMGARTTAERLAESGHRPVQPLEKTTGKQR